MKSRKGKHVSSERNQGDCDQWKAMHKGKSLAVSGAMGMNVEKPTPSSSLAPKPQTQNDGLGGRRKGSVEEQRAQKHNWFLGGRQIAYLIYNHFQATGAYDGAQGLSDLFNICLHDDDVHDFDTRWDQVLLATSEIPQENAVYKIQPLDKYNLTRAKRKLLRKRKRIHESFSSRLQSRKSFTLTILWNWHKLIVRQHSIAPRSLVLRKQLFDDCKKVLQQYCYNQDWMKNGGLIPWNVTAICEMSKTSWQMGKHRMKGDFRNHLMDQ